MRLRKQFINLAVALLFILFSYSGFVKLSDYRFFQGQLLQSPLIPSSVSMCIAIALPLGEIGLAAALMYEQLRQRGLYVSFLLMFAFTLYLLALNNFYEKVPCACGGVLGRVSYNTHIIFNLCVTACAFVAWLFSTTYENDNQSLPL